MASPNVVTRGSEPVSPTAGHGSQGALGPLASPTARRAALEQGVDLKDVKGSGDHGRITRDDVMRAGIDVPPRTEPPMSPTQRGQAESQMRAQVGASGAWRRLRLVQGASLSSEAGRSGRSVHAPSPHHRRPHGLLEDRLAPRGDGRRV
jgi:pyruvate/2-oxoglutarate dehydrogenase complex dihydrolipoamide acyltransferase (E2) component